MLAKFMTTASLVFLVPLSSFASDIRQRPFAYSFDAASAQSGDTFVVCSNCPDSKLTILPAITKLAVRISESMPIQPTTTQSEVVAVAPRNEQPEIKGLLGTVHFQFDSSKLSQFEQGNLEKLSRDRRKQGGVMRKTIALLTALLVPTLAHALEQGAIQKQKTAIDQAIEKPVEGEFPTVVLPESSTGIRLSSSDINRISCPGDIREVLTSTEKGITIKITGKDAFVKFKVTKKGDKFFYSSTPTELYVVCGEKVFSLVAFPQRVPSQTIRLTSGQEKKIKENLSLYAGLPFEKKVLKAIREVYTENIPDSYTISKKEKRFFTFREILLTLKRTVDIEGEGLRIKEFEASLRGETPEFKMNEKMFLRTALVDNPIAVSLERHVLRTGDSSRVFVVEQRAEKQGGRRLTGDLPVMDQPRQSLPANKSGNQKEPTENRTESDVQEADDEK